MKRVVITGIGAVSPIGNNVNELWDSIVNNKCGIDYITHFDTADFKVKLAGEVKNLKLEDYFDNKTIKNNDKFILYGRIAAKEAAIMARLSEIKERDRIGVLFTSGIGGIETIQNTAILMEEKGVDRISAYFIPKVLINLVAGNIAIDNNCHGYCSSTVTACAASTNAIGDAFNRIRYGYEDVMITGGTEASICKIGIGGFMAMKALSTSNDPNRASIPFDNDRNGFVMGEGAGCLILEELEHAKRRGAKILAEIVGYGASCDAFHITSPDINGDSCALAILNAISDAKINPSDIDYINAHGTSTHLNDITEVNAIKLAFKDHAKNLIVSSTKGNTGHLLGAAGAIESIISIKAIENALIPATLNCINQDQKCDLNVSPNQNTFKNIKYAMKTSLGFGGHNAAIIYKRWDE